MMMLDVRFMSRPKGKKADMAGQMLVYVMSMVLVGLIVVFGYKAIGGFISQTEEISKIKFFSDFDAIAQRMRYRDVEIRTFVIPKQYTKLCIVSKASPGNIDTMTEIPPLVRTQWKNTKNNVFLLSGVSEFYPHATMILNEPINLRLDTNGNGADDATLERDFSYLCMSTIGGKARLRMEEKGKYLFIASNFSD